MIGRKIGFVTEKRSLNLALREVALFVMKDCTDKLGHAMNLMVREGGDCIILQQSRTANLVDYVPPLLSRVPIYATAGGKVLLAELPVSLQEIIVESCEMKPLTGHTITDRGILTQVLRETAERGYAIDNREASENGSCISVPVRDHDATVVAALSFSGLIGIADPQELLRYLPILQEASEEISHSLYDIWKW